MYICKECLTKNYKNEWLYMILSYGRCEICGKSRDCNDYPSRELTRRRDKVDAVRKVGIDIFNALIDLI